MTDAEILKALEWCTDTIPPCHACKYDEDTYTSDECMGKLMKDALDLINRQQAEILQLKSDLSFIENNYECLKSGYERTLKISSNRKDRIVQMAIKLQQAKSEARKEFAERLKLNKAIHYCVCGRDTNTADVFNRHIDFTLKEMESENNG